MIIALAAIFGYNTYKTTRYQCFFFVGQWLKNPVFSPSGGRGRRFESFHSDQFLALCVLGILRIFKENYIM